MKSPQSKYPPPPTPLNQNLQLKSPEQDPPGPTKPACKQPEMAQVWGPV